MNQKELFLAIAKGESLASLAKKNKVSSSSIRHRVQKYERKLRHLGWRYRENYWPEEYLGLITMIRKYKHLYIPLFNARLVTVVELEGYQ